MTLILRESAQMVGASPILEELPSRRRLAVAGCRGVADQEGPEAGVGS